MKLLLNDKEIAHFLTSLLDIKPDVKKGVEFNDFNLAEIIIEFNKRKETLTALKKYKKEKGFDPAFKRKFRDKIVKAVTKDLDTYRKDIKERIEVVKSIKFHTVHKNINYFIDQLGEETVFALYRKSKKVDFVKGTGLALDRKGQFIRRKDFNEYKEDCLIRNTVGNEGLLVSKIDNNYPMWFIDSGYTNFLEPNKKWHRLVRNHLHFGKYFDAPSDRLSNIAEFPKQWREGGEIIYIIEPGPFAAGVFHVDLKTWKYDVARELRKYTDKRIVFRKKAPKKVRPSLVKQLQDEDYYCVVSLNSNAATEAIWQGVPVITLGTHITNPVSRSKLSEINDLYRGPLGNWLAYLSYSQFTKEELLNGYAAHIVKKYHV